MNHNQENHDQSQKQPAGSEQAQNRGDNVSENSQLNGDRIPQSRDEHENRTWEDPSSAPSDVDLDDNIDS